MSKLPDVSFAELAVHLQGAGAGTRVAIGYVRHEPFADAPGIKAEIINWQKDGEIAEQLGRVFAVLARREGMIRVFLDTLVAVEEDEDGRQGSNR